MERGGALLVATLGRMHEGGAEREARARLELGVAGVVGARCGPTHAVDRHLDRPGTDRGFARLEQRPPARAAGDLRLGGGTRAHRRRAREDLRHVDAELVAEQRRGSLHLEGGGRGVPGGGERPHEEDVRLFAQRVRLDQTLRESHGALRVAHGEPPECAFAQDRVRHREQAPALVEEPRLEAGTRLDLDAFQEIVAQTGESDGLPRRPGREHVHVDDAVRGEIHRDPVATPETDVVPEDPAQLREVPSEGAGRVIRLREQQVDEVLTAR